MKLILQVNYQINFDYYPRFDYSLRKFVHRIHSILRKDGHPGV